MNARALNALADVICRAQEQDRTPMGIAVRVEAAGMLQSPESAAEMEHLRAARRVEHVWYCHKARMERRERERADRLAGEARALRTERAATNAALAAGDEQREQLLKRIAALEERAKVVEEFVAERAGYIVAI